MKTINKRLYEHGFDCIAEVHSTSLEYGIFGQIVKEKQKDYTEIKVIAADLAIAGCELEDAGYEWKEASEYHFIYGKPIEQAEKNPRRITFEKGKKVMFAFLRNL